MIRKNINELLLAIYIFLFPGLSWAIPSVLQYVIIGLILFLSIIINKGLNVNKSFVFINLFVFIFFIFSFLLNNNDFLLSYLKNYILFGFITMYLFSRVKNYDIMLKFMAYLILFLFLLSFSDYKNNYMNYGGYMSYGLFLILPSFLLFHLMRKYYKIKFFAIFEVMSIISLLYSNRNSILICIVAFFILDFLLSDNNMKRILKYLFLSILLFVVVLNLNNIIYYLAEYTNNQSYAIRAFITMLLGKSNGLANRDFIWALAFKQILNNPIFGMGIGGFQSVYMLYCHNLFLDLYLSFGVVSIVIIILVAIKIISIFKKPDIFSLFIIIIGVLPLIFNNTFFDWKYFWILVIYLLERKESKDEKITFDNNTNF